MSGMVVLMVRTNSGFVYPGLVIYPSAMYTLLYDGSVCGEPPSLSEDGQPHPAGGKGRQLYLSGYVSAGLTDRHDQPIRRK